MDRKKICLLGIVLAGVICVLGIGRNANFKIVGERDNETERDLFSDYKGEKVQRVISEEGDVYSPASCNDIFYYQEEQGEDLQTIVAKMKAAILEPLTVETSDRPFTVTAFDVDTQTEIIPFPLEQSVIEQYDIPQWIQEWEWDESAEEAWLLPKLEGYYRFEGIDLVSMDSLLEEESKGDMVPFVAQGSEESFQFILMRRENVFRLQRAVTLQEMIE